MAIKKGGENMGLRVTPSEFGESLQRIRTLVEKMKELKTSFIQKKTVVEGNVTGKDFEKAREVYARMEKLVDQVIESLSVSYNDLNNKYTEFNATMIKF